MPDFSQKIIEMAFGTTKAVTELIAPNIDRFLDFTIEFGGKAIKFVAGLNNLIAGLFE